MVRFILIVVVLLGSIAVTTHKGSNKEVASLSVKYSDRGREMRFAKKTEAYSIPPRNMYWVTGHISMVSIVFDLDSTSRENDSVYINLDSESQCGDANQPKVSRIVLEYDNNKCFCPGASEVRFSEGQRIALAFSEDGHLFDAIWPVFEEGDVPLPELGKE